jgi:hypothetical protein
MSVNESREYFVPLIVERVIGIKRYWEFLGELARCEKGFDGDKITNFEFERDADNEVIVCIENWMRLS